MTATTTRNHPRRRKHTLIRRVITRAIALAALALPVVVPPAGAVIGGSADGARHPYVGAVDGRPVGGATEFGSGVLISPTVFLTVAHGTAHFDAAGITRARVTFDPVVSNSSTWHEGTIHTNPGYEPSAQGQRGDFGDLGVIVFDAPIPGIAPASLPSAGYLDRISGHPALEIPGYGVSQYLGGSSGGGKRQPDFTSGGTRNLADEVFDSLSPGWLRLHAAGTADICFGDSGSPSILSGTNLVLGITAVEWSLAGSECESGPWEQRVDTPAARAFLSQYVRLP
jgi:trypsin